MTLDLSSIIAKLKAIEDAFNASAPDAYADRYALIMALNHIAEVELPMHGHWEKTYREAMLKDKGCDITKEKI